MNKINFAKWKAYDISFIFQNKKIKKFSNIPESEGDTPFVSCTSKNNGIDRYCGEKPIDGNCITVSTNGRCFDSFYQSKPFAVSNDVEVLYSDKLNKFVALFIVSILNLEHHKWTFGRKPKHSKVFRTKILLPRDEDGFPDYKMMETFMKKYYDSLNDEVKKNKELILKFIKPSLRGGHNVVDTTWDRFKINDIFQLYATPSGIDKNKLTNTDVSEYPFVSRTDKNNGIDIWVGKQNKPLEDGVCLSIGLDTQTVFYRDVPFYTGQNIQILRHDEMKKMQCFFVKTILDNMIKAKFVWGGRGCTLGRFKNEYILLPSIKTNGTIKPNWKYMGDCMEQLYEKNIFLLKKNKNLINKFID